MYRSCDTARSSVAHIGLTVGLVCGLLALLPASAAAQDDCPPSSPDDWIADDVGLQCLLTFGGTVYLTPGDPGYIVNRGLIIHLPGTRLLSTEAPAERATIIAGRDLESYMLITPPYGVDDIEIGWIRFDGKVHDEDYRRKERCDAPHDTPGNVGIWGERTYIHHIESVNALCGSGLKLVGREYRVLHNYIGYNGRDRHSGIEGDPWADGITALSCFGGEIAHNAVVDNTDVGISSGGGNCWVHDNDVWQGGAAAFAGIHVGWFQEADGDHSGSIYEKNQVTAVVDDRIGIGMLIGYHPWGADKMVRGGEYLDNVITGAVINLAVEGAADVTVRGNSFSGAAGTGGFIGPTECVIDRGVEYVVNDNNSSGAIQDGYVRATLPLGSACGASALGVNGARP